MRWSRLTFVTLALAAMALAGSGCSETSSELVPTSDIDAYIVVTGEGDGVSVSADLRTDVLTSVNLDGDDELVASAGDESTDLDDSGPYSGHLDVEPAAGTEVLVSLERGVDEQGDQEEDAPRSTVSLPDPVGVRSPPAGSGFDRRRDLRLELGDATETRVTWYGRCVVDGDGELAGAYTTGSELVIPARSVKRKEGVNGRCPVTFVVTRERQGDLDDAFDKGSIVARQQASVPLELGAPAAAQTPPEQTAPTESLASAEQPGPPTADRADDNGLGAPLLWLVVGVVIGGAAAGAAGLVISRRRG